MTVIFHTNSVSNRLQHTSNDRRMRRILYTVRLRKAQAHPGHRYGMEVMLARGGPTEIYKVNRAIYKKYD
jgi:hypothetical protein